MSEPKEDVVDPAYRKKETTVNSNAQPETSYALVGACFSAAASAGCLATLTLYAGISPKPWFFYFAGFYVPVGAGLAMYMGLRFLREK
ncbi:hypothetical protein AAGW04_18170 [Pectobacterium aroidearum]|uniref:hypothetical protein n=1 Tax=Pectobacterium aroidearum TaxID=1201031 RepID=UPI00315959BE